MQHHVVLTMLLCMSWPAVTLTVRADCSIAGDDTLDCDGTVYRAVDDECTYYVDLAAHQTAHPDVALPGLKKTILDNYAADAVPDPVVIELTDYVDCTQTDHNFSDASFWGEFGFYNKPSRLMNISGKMFRVTGAPDGGFDTFYYHYDVTTGGVAGVPHLLMAELSNDQERYTSLQIHHPDDIVVKPGQPWAPPYTGEPTNNPYGDPWYETNFPRIEQGPVFGPDVGVCAYTGLEIPVDHQPFNVGLIFHPKTSVVQVGITGMGVNTVRTENDGAAVSRMWVFRFVQPLSDRFPAHALPDPPHKQRRIGIYMTHPAYFYMHYGAPIRLLEHRRASLTNLVQHLRFCGFNYLVFNAVNGADRTEKSWYPGSAHYDWNSAGDLLSELPPIAEQEGIELVPLITSLKRNNRNDGLTFGPESYQIMTNGQQAMAFGNPMPDPLRPEVQQLVFNLLNEIGARCGQSPAVRGIGLRMSGTIGTCYASHQDHETPARRSGYSTWDLQQFKNDTGSAVPVSPPQTAYDWLRARANEWEAWIRWRCEKTREFWLACRDVVRSHRPDLLFVVQCDLPSRCPGSNIQWGSGESPYDLLRHHGYDPEMFVSDTGIVITRGMMIARDRNKNSARWGPPVGTNWENYRLFHYAPGLAEMYRTAEGRSCEFWQNYWEENANPYFEFGAPPNGHFRTQTPAAPGRHFFEAAIMSVRRQDPDTMTWLGWNRPTLTHENDLRKFAQAFRALPVVDPVPFDGTITPNVPDEVVSRWYDDRLAVLNDSSSARTITLTLTDPLPTGDELIDVVTGRRLIAAGQAERQTGSFAAEAYSLHTFLHVIPPGPRASFTTDPLPSTYPLTVVFHDTSVATNITSWDWDFGDGTFGTGQEPTHTYANFGTYQVTLTITADEGVFDVTRSIRLTPPPLPVPGVDNPSFEDNGGSLNGWEIVPEEGSGPDNPPWGDDNAWGVIAPDGTHFGGKITNGGKRSFYIGQVVGTTGYDAESTLVTWRLDTWVQLRCTHEGGPSPAGVHQVWEIGWNEDGSEPKDIMNCDHYQVVADLDATYTGNSQTEFFPLTVGGMIAGVTGLRGVALRVHMFNDSAWWWTFMNTDDVNLVVEPIDDAPPDFDADGDVDQDDFGIFQACLTGPELGPPSAGCEAVDLDYDLDVDQSDFGLFQRCYTGSGVAANPTCADPRAY